MAGIYVHIPFCNQACHYCNFHFSTSLKLKNDFIKALLKEVRLQEEYLQGEKVESIYFGGGTPSILEGKDLELVLETLALHFDCNHLAELTLEANPDDMDPDLIKSWRQSGINRLSIGVQSFYDEDLKWMNRSHSADQAKRGIHAAMDCGFSNISIDLIYGYPKLSDNHWRKNVQTAIEMKIPHLSCYALTVEPGTTLQHLIQKKRTIAPSPDEQASQYLFLMQWLEEAGYEHYEISNFSKPGMKSRHNSSYWQGKRYLGLGPSAHSYNLKSRQWNVSNNNRYIESIAKGLVPFEKEELSAVQTLNEYIMISLRTSEGIDLKEIQRRFGFEIRKQLLSGAEEYLRENKMILEGGFLVLSRKGKLLADGIAAHLFFENEENLKSSF